MRQLLVTAVGAAALVTSVTACGAGRPELGDCVAVTGEDDIAKVDCSSSEAAYRVIGVEEEGTFLPSFACQEFPEAVQVYSETGGSGDGYTLCLGNK